MCVVYQSVFTWFAAVLARLSSNEVEALCYNKSLHLWVLLHETSYIMTKSTFIHSYTYDKPYMLLKMIWIISWNAELTRKLLNSHKRSLCPNRKSHKSFQRRQRFSKRPHKVIWRHLNAVTMDAVSQSLTGTQLKNKRLHIIQILSVMCTLPMLPRIIVWRLAVKRSRDNKSKNTQSSVTRCSISNQHGCLLLNPFSIDKMHWRPWFACDLHLGALQILY